MLLVLLVALASALLVTGLAASFTAGSAGLKAEEAGRDSLARADNALVALAAAARERWEPRLVESAESPAGEVQLVPEVGGLLAAVAGPWPGTGTGGGSGASTGAPFMYRVAAHVELGHDGLDLPRAAVVAEDVRIATGRGLIGIASPDGVGAFYVATRLPVAAGTVAEGGTVRALTDEWRLDEGTKETATREAGRPGSRISVLAGSPGEWVAAPMGNPGAEPEQSGIVVLTGGAWLDCRDRGDVFGVLVTEGGGVQLEGTRLHGAVYTGGVVELGDSGQVVWSPPVYRWATDRSVVRVRLVPGSRSEQVVP